MYTLKLNNAPTCGLLLFFLLALHIPLPHPPGNGLLLPSNIIAWSFMAFISLLVCLAKINPKAAQARLIISPLTRYMAIATGMLAVPLLYTPEPWANAGLIQWAGVAGGFVFFFCLVQGELTLSHHRLLLAGLAAAALIQAIVGALYLLVWLPGPGEWYVPGPGVGGILLQQNVAATFMLVGLGAALLLWLEPLCRGRSATRMLPLLVVVAVPFMLVFLQSRIGVLSGVVLLVCFGLLYWRRDRRRFAVAMGCALIGIALANALIWFAPSGGVDLIHEASTSYRLQMLQETSKMIAQHPLLGWGLGSFSYNYARFLVATGTAAQESVVVLHPHNEWLYGWAEGGIVTVLAYLVLLFAGWKLWRQASQRDRLQGVAYRRALWVLLLPMLLHTQVEYPFYLSAVLWLVFLLLLALADGACYSNALLLPGAVCTERYNVALPAIALRIGSLLMGAAALLALAFMTSGLQSGLVLTQLEHSQIERPGQAAQIDMSAVQHAQWNPWIFEERFEFDHQLNNLLRFNATRDPQLLVGYLRWSAEYLSSKISPDVFASRMMILDAAGRHSQAQRIRIEGHFLFPRDVRFNAASPAKAKS